MSGRFSRRKLLGGVTGGFLSYAIRNHASRLLAATPKGKRKATRCLVLWMEGGPSQLETFDPKPGQNTGGPTRSIATSVRGIQIADTLPQIAQHMSDLAVIRNLTSDEGDHFRGAYYLHTGFTQVPGFPRPSLGSVVSHELASLSNSSAAAPAVLSHIPKNVTIGGPAFGPAYLGLDHAPFAINQPDEALQTLRRLRRRRSRLNLIQELSQEFDQQHRDKSVQQRSALIESLRTLVDTPFVDSLDLSNESVAMRTRYGETDFGQRCLLARRLLEIGVDFVEVQHGGWDTHNDNFTTTRRLCKQIDGPWSALMSDLKSSGLLDETLVIWMGEFGRTPVINGNGGRDHFPMVTPVVLAGAGVRGGQVIGSTNKSGTAIEGETHSVADLFATIFAALGIDPNTEFTTAFGAPTAITDDGEVINKLLA